MDNLAGWPLDRCAATGIAAGALGVLITSALYGLVSPLTVLPIPAVPMVEAFGGALHGAVLLRIAGTVGLFSDVVLAAASLALGLRGPPQRAQVAIGWLLVGLASLVFLAVDATLGFVLAPLARLGEPLVAFAAFKWASDALFALGVAVFGAGSLCLFAAERRARPRRASAWVWVLGLLAGFAGVAGGLGYFLGLLLAPLVGAALFLGALTFVAYGVSLSRRRGDASLA